MIVYFCLYISVLWGIYISKYLKEKNALVIIVLAEAFFISTFRSFMIGADYETYVGLYKSGRFEMYGYGWGYCMSNYIAQTLGDSYAWLAFSINILIFSCLFYAIKKNVYKEYWMFAVAIWILNPYGYIQSSFNMLRQGEAMAVLLLASQFLTRYDEKGKSVKFGNYIIFLLLLFCAAGFHKSAWIFILLVPFSIVKWRKEFHVVLLLLCTGINILSQNSTFMMLFTKVFGFEGYLTYFESIFDFPLYTIFIMCYTGFLILRYNSLFMNGKEKWYIDLYICSLCILLLLVKNDQAYRLYVYLFYITIKSVTIILKNMPGRLSQILRYGYIAYYSLMFWGFLIMQKLAGNANYYPFTFYWQVKK